MAELLVDVQRAVAVLTLNRPEQRNALSPGLMTALLEELARLRDDDAVRAIVLTGAGEKAFCAGGDLSAMADADAGEAARGQYRALLEALVSVGKPTVAAVNGAALGGGLGLTLACDLAVAAETATFGTPEVKVGLFPMMVTALLARHVGMKRAFELALLGERVSAAVVLQWGLVNAVVSPVALGATAFEMASRIAAVGPSVLRLGRGAVYTAWDMDYRLALEYLASALSENVRLPEAVNGVTAFLSGRRPSGAPVVPPEDR